MNQQPDKVQFYTTLFPGWFPDQVRRVAALPEVSNITVWDARSRIINEQAPNVGSGLILVVIEMREGRACFRELSWLSLLTTEPHAIGDILLGTVNRFLRASERVS